MEIAITKPLMLQTNNLLSEFICPVCLNYFHPPIKQCVTGHVYCSDCFGKMAKCPECRAAKSDCRNFTLERIHNMLTFPCRYHDDGCDYAGLGDNAYKHETTCTYRPRECILRFNKPCGWVGNYDEMVNHCFKEHALNTYNKSEQAFICSRFATTCINRQYLIVFIAFDHIFRCTWLIDVPSRICKFGVYAITKPTEEYFYTIMFLVGDSEENALSITARCDYLEDESVKIDPEKHVIVLYDMLAKFSTPEGDLNYVVKIHEGF